MKIDKDKIIGMLLGCFLGDSLGKPVEGWSAEAIKNRHGRLTEIISPSDHKWFKGHKAGTWSDDTFLTIAVARGLIDGSGLNMDAQATSHIAAFKESTDGWGPSTKKSIHRLADGTHWSQCGQVGSGEGKGTGAGNGVPMKISPVSAYCALKSKIGEEEHNLKLHGEAIEFVYALSDMTHHTSISASAALAQMFAVEYCLKNNANSFVPEKFAKIIHGASLMGRLFLPETITDDISDRLGELVNYKEYPSERIVSEFGGGHCYCYFSVPFTMMFFLRGWQSLESLFDVLNSGGDTDSNCSMCGAMLGALHGASIFSNNLVNVLDSTQKKIVFDLAEEFYSKFSEKVI